MTVHLGKLIHALAHDRYRGALIFGAAGGENGVGKTEYLRKFQQAHPEFPLSYLDVQQALLAHQNRALVFDLTPSRLLEWGVSLARQAALPEVQGILLDNFDVVVNLWDRRKKEEFVQRLQRLEQTAFPIPVAAMAQDDPVFQQAYQQQPASALRRIIKFHELEAV